MERDAWHVMPQVTPASSEQFEKKTSREKNNHFDSEKNSGLRVAIFLREHIANHKELFSINEFSEPFQLWGHRAEN